MASDGPRPLSSVTVVAFALHESQLWVLLAKTPDDAGKPASRPWRLPEGPVDVERDGDLLSCARRVLKEKTGLPGAYLEQLAVGEARLATHGAGQPPTPTWP